MRIVWREWSAEGNGGPLASALVRYQLFEVLGLTWHAIYKSFHIWTTVIASSYLSRIFELDGRKADVHECKDWNELEQ